MTDKRERIAYLTHIEKYLAVLARITGKVINRDDLEALEETDKVRKKAAHYLRHPLNKYEINYDSLSAEKLDNFFDKLYESNDNKVYLWVEGANECGLLKIHSIKSINFSFFFNPDLIQVLSITTEDLEDKLLLDIDLDEDNSPKMLTIEYQGKNWSGVEF